MNINVEQILYEIGKGLVVKAQANPQIIEMAKKLLANLTSKNITADKPNSNLYLQDLLTDGKADIAALLKFLSTNAVRYANLRIVYPNTPIGSFESAQGKGADFASLSDAQKALYFQFPPNTPNFEFNVYKDGLVAYLNDLKGKASSNQLLKAILDKILIQVNSFGLTISTVKDDQAKQQATDQTQQLGPKNISYKIVDEQTSQYLEHIFPAGFDGPFDLTTKAIDIGRFEGFLAAFTQTLAIPRIQQELKYNLNSVRSAISSTSQMINQWKTSAAPAGREGFEFNISAPNRASLFVETYANADFALAIQMLTTMIRLCNAMANLVHQCLASPTITEFASKELIDAQYKAGINYATYMQDAISTIRNMQHRNR